MREFLTQAQEDSRNSPLTSRSVAQFAAALGQVNDFAIKTLEQRSFNAVATAWRNASYGEAKIIQNTTLTA